MISAPACWRAGALIAQLHRTGARWSRICAEVGIAVRTYQRWTAGEAVQGDGRPAVHARHVHQPRRPGW